MKGCLVRYALLGWTGYMPQQCHRNMLLVPINYARWLWGWPHRFLQRMAKVETHVFLVGPYRGEGLTRGLDDLATIRQLPRRYGGGIWTDHIETVGPALQRWRKSEVGEPPSTVPKPSPRHHSKRYRPVPPPVPAWLWGNQPHPPGWLR
jgi:hypothetical protein